MQLSLAETWNDMQYHKSKKLHKAYQSVTVMNKVRYEHYTVHNLVNNKLHTCVVNFVKICIMYIILYFQTYNKVVSVFLNYNFWLWLHGEIGDVFSLDRFFLSFYVSVFCQIADLWQSLFATYIYLQLHGFMVFAGDIT